jgi:hypothetical protein
MNDDKVTKDEIAQSFLLVSCFLLETYQYSVA